MMHGAGRRWDKDESTPRATLDGSSASAADKSKVPILPHARQASYGSCDGANDRAAGQAHTAPAGHPVRHQIGSEVLDFGEWPAQWPGLANHKPVKKPSKSGLSWLGLSDALSRKSTLKRVSSALTPSHTASRKAPPDPSIPQHLDERLKTRTMAETRAASRVTRAVSNKSKSVFSLFGLNRSQKEQSQLGTELGDLTNTTGRPRANAISAAPDDLHTVEDEDLPSVSAWSNEGSDRPRQLSLTNYLEEISRIGANSGWQPKPLPPPIKPPSLAKSDTRAISALETGTDGDYGSQQVKREGAGDGEITNPVESQLTGAPKPVEGISSMSQASAQEAEAPTEVSTIVPREAAPNNVTNSAVNTPPRSHGVQGKKDNNINRTSSTQASPSRVRSRPKTPAPNPVQAKAALRSKQPKVLVPPATKTSATDDNTGTKDKGAVKRGRSKDKEAGKDVEGVKRQDSTVCMGKDNKKEQKV